jgi:hypothetical protein
MQNKKIFQKDLLVGAWGYTNKLLLFNNIVVANHHPNEKSTSPKFFTQNFFKTPKDPFGPTVNNSMKLLLQLMTAVTATGMITFTVTHLHLAQFAVQWRLWALHWLVAIPIAFCTVRYITPVYQRLLDKLHG